MSRILELIPLFYYDAAAIAIYLSLFLGFRKQPERTKTTVLYLLCVINFLAYIINDYYFYIRGDSLLTMLPLQLCNIAVFLIPLTILLKKRILYDFIFYICALGALIALIIPSSDYIGQTWSLMTVSFFVFHYIIVIIPFLLAGWGFYTPTPTVKSVLQLSAGVFVLALFLHIINLAFRRWFGIEADYFFTIIEYSAPRNPAFELFSRVIPVDLFYLLPALPILWIYMPLVSLPWNVGKWFARPDRGSLKF